MKTLTPLINPNHASNRFDSWQEIFLHVREKICSPFQLVSSNGFLHIVDLLAMLSVNFIHLQVN